MAAMGRTTVLLWLMLNLGEVTAQTDKVGRDLPQWLMGLIAVSGFLFLVFVAFIVNKAWCNDSRPETKACDCGKTPNYANTNGEHYDTQMDMVSCIDDEVAYENVALEGFEDKVTAL